MSARGSLALSGPRWVAVRQHRAALRTGAWVLGAALAVTAALRWWAAASRNEAACAAGDWLNCEDRIFQGYGTPSELLRLAMQYGSQGLLFLPALVGAFVAGPLIARELESGTHRLAWTQSVSPARWFATKVGAAAVVVTAAAAVLTGAFVLGSAPFAGTFRLNWPDRGVYEASGPVLSAYCLLGVGLGALVGLLVRRTVAAMAAAGALTAAVVLGLGSFRWDVWPFETLSGAGTDRETGVRALPPDIFQLRSGYVTQDGERLPYDACWAPDSGWDTCPPELGIESWFVEYHPASHFWPVQFAESGLALALAALALLAAFRVLRGRHA